ncbi:DUF6702 family protein [Maricaulis salignorans]|uniref:Uncharacterized protein n=1 Tax=Maricaulis salignorans TaxID=144026 RepID=A0A1G9NY84_9PROT|nr:DUF6702 family protein [Maricaulis salignorans]SDL91538.1 hypothetical protein SAMN04488568_10338 [Maricaulis salignorans]
MATPAAAHRVHAGVTDVVISAATGELQISHRIYGHDLLEALGADVVDEEAWYASAEGLAATGRYAQTRFRIGEGDGRLLEPVYVGAELDGELLWIYFAAQAPADTSAFVVDNDLLADAFEDQVMMTNITIDSIVRTAMQGPGRREPVRLRFSTD